MVVDDHPENVEFLEIYLIPQGYEIVKAANGEEALEKLSGQHIDLILLDVLMPGVDGFEVTRRIRQDDTQRLLPIILVASLRETEDRQKGIEDISKKFEIGVAVSERILLGLDDPSAYHIRFIGKVGVKGRREDVSIFEIYDGDPEASIKKKDSIKAAFERGLNAFYSEEYEQAWISGTYATRRRFFSLLKDRG